MASPQRSIFVEGTSHHWFQTYQLGASSPAEIATALQAVREAAQGETARDTVNLVIMFGPAMAAQLGIECPESFTELPVIGTPELHPGIDQADVLLWMHSGDIGHNYDVAKTAVIAFAPLAAPSIDLSTYLYRDSRDLTGFIDGTENPPVSEAAEIVVVPDGEPGAGSSVALAQWWLHNLTAFAKLEVPEQESIFGRTKADSVELAEVPETAHIGRVVIEDEAGEEQEIYRRSAPWGTPTNGGLFFIGFTDDQSKTDEMLHRMYGTDDGVLDRLLEFSEARSSGSYLAPSAEALDELLA